MTLAFITGESRNLNISVNDGAPISTSLNGNSWSNIAKQEFEITLNKGNNTVRLYADAGWMADIDCMKLELIEPTSIQPTLTDESVKVEVLNNKVEVTTNAATEITIVDMAGKRVWNDTISGKRAIALPTGTYLVNGKKIIVK
jgi:hypothetical protein